MEDKKECPLTPTAGLRSSCIALRVRSQWPSCKVSARDRRVPGSRPDSTCMWSWCTLNLTSWVKCLFAGVVWELGEGVVLDI
ncbi:hypothetical protein AVEN_197843-1 [Araneus ventricosus]|uniref:Uncharacterized protein n=1 Tax=Araneus ventricosus TaxID=182803 RepID=A0A4Y2M818_ARAVE|nr:hypothetical protein AVEN_197843-1 [Araneus ventricosus]